MTAWTHHDPAVRKLIQQAQAQAWDQGADAAVTTHYDPRSSRMTLKAVIPFPAHRNPYREENR